MVLSTKYLAKSSQKGIDLLLGKRCTTISKDAFFDKGKLTLTKTTRKKTIITCGDAHIIIAFFRIVFVKVSLPLLK